MVRLVCLAQSTRSTCNTHCRKTMVTVLTTFDRIQTERQDNDKPPSLLNLERKCLSKESSEKSVAGSSYQLFELMVLIIMSIAAER